MYKETGKSDPLIKKKLVGAIRAEADIRLRQRLYINSLKYAERAKGNHE